MQHWVGGEFNLRRFDQVDAVESDSARQRVILFRLLFLFRRLLLLALQKNQIIFGKSLLLGRLLLLVPDQRRAERQGHHRGHQDRRGADQQRTMPTPPSAQLRSKRLWIDRDRLVRQPVVHVRRQIQGSRVTILRLQRHRLQADRLKCRRGVGLDSAWRREFAVLHLG